MLMMSIYSLSRRLLQSYLRKIGKNGTCHTTFKCEFLRITNKLNPILSQYLLNNEVILEVTHTKYLGGVIDSKLSWSQHFKRRII